MNIPGSYAEWTQYFNMLKAGTNDAEVIECMEKGSISWTAGVAERFANQLLDVIDHKISNASDKLQRYLDMAGSNETSIVTALTGFRREVVFLKRLASLSAIPEEHRKHFIDQIKQFAANTQKSLEKSAASDRSGRLSSVFKYNRIDNIF